MIRKKSYIFSFNSRHSRWMYANSCGILRVAAEEAAITADRELLGDARLLSYGWNLENPYTDPEAARLEGEYDDDMHAVLLTRLPEVS